MPATPRRHRSRSSRDRARVRLPVRSTRSTTIGEPAGDRPRCRRSTRRSSRVARDRAPAVVRSAERHARLGVPGGRNRLRRRRRHRARDHDRRSGRRRAITVHIRRRHRARVRLPVRQPPTTIGDLARRPTRRAAVRRDAVRRVARDRTSAVGGGGERDGDLPFRGSPSAAPVQTESCSGSPRPTPATRIPAPLAFVAVTVHVYDFPFVNAAHHDRRRGARHRPGRAAVRG